MIFNIAYKSKSIQSEIKGIAILLYQIKKLVSEKDQIKNNLYVC